MAVAFRAPSPPPGGDHGDPEAHLPERPDQERVGFVAPASSPPPHNLVVDCFASKMKKKKFAGDLGTSPVGGRLLSELRGCVLREFDLVPGYRVDVLPGDGLHKVPLERRQHLQSRRRRR